MQRLFFSILIVSCMLSSCKKDDDDTEPETPAPFVPCSADLTDDQFQWESNTTEITSYQCGSTFIQGMASSGLVIIELGDPVDSTLKLDITPSNPESGEASLLIQTSSGQPSQRATEGFLYAELLDGGAIRYSWCNVECVAPPAPNSPDDVVTSGRLICQ